jgi:hypothetical protein
MTETEDEGFADEKDQIEVDEAIVCPAEFVIARSITNHRQ